MKCSCCGEEVGSVTTCPICGATLTKPTPVVSGAAVAAVAGESHISGADLFEQNKNGVLEINVKIGDSFFCGSGYLVNKEGYAVTNSHVVLENGKLCSQIAVAIANEIVPASVVALGTKDDDEFCSNLDLAVIKLYSVPPTATPITFGDSKKVRTGERIYIIGNSLGEGTCITSGIISDNDRDGQFMYDSATNGGNSGGPVFNEDGYVIATHVKGGRRDNFGGKAQGMNGGIPCEYAKKLLDVAKVKYKSK